MAAGGCSLAAPRSSQHRGGHGRHPKGLSFCMTCEKMPRKLNQSHASFFSKMGPAPPRGRPDRPLPVAPLPVPTARRRIPGLVYLGPRAQGIQWLCRLYAPRGYLSRLAVCSVWCWTGSSCISSLVLVMRGARVHMYVICFQLVRCWSLARKPQRCQWNISHTCLYEAGRVPLSSSSSTSSLIVSSRLVEHAG